ncbi:DUF6571 family protein [Streptomyces tagetis]|uniref:Uncharacterized protein n=1 Tax=Streptomyces tagetis TaxID=2820809 RepID=A0A940XMI5_9ACTN|nr:DUF6571 family protein [Streptomyces sp. RG38]MBQ0827495.1 hypothetical protein [Streptomyces sp. RG38]
MRSSGPSKCGTSWQDRIDQLVKDTTDADAGVEVAFNAVVVDPTSPTAPPTASTARPRTTSRSTRPRTPRTSPRGSREARRSPPRDSPNWTVRSGDNGKSREFTQTLLSGLGASGTIELANRLSTLSHGGKDRGTFAALQKGLADSLATATKGPGSAFSEKFLADMRRAGVQKFDLDVAAQRVPVGVGHGQPVRGYQSLVTLMQAGDGYSGHFLKDLATDIRAVEDKKQGGDPDVWDLSGGFGGEDVGWFADDPLDGVLGIMAKDPGTATGYLDPGPDGKNDNLTYLLTERDWHHVDTTRWQGKVEVTGEDTFDQDVRTGPGLALAAGSTGDVAGADGTAFGRHTAAQARVMHGTVNLLDYGHIDGTFGEDRKEPRTGKADELPAREEYAALRGPLSQALADYSPDVVEAINGDAPGGRAGKVGVYENGDDSQIQNSRSSLIRIMRGVSEADDIGGPLSQQLAGGSTGGRGGFGQGGVEPEQRRGAGRHRPLLRQVGRGTKSGPGDRQGRGRRGPAELCFRTADRVRSFAVPLNPRPRQGIDTHMATSARRKKTLLITAGALVSVSALVSAHMWTHGLP